mmetsp:Transcript_2608/g.4587  ORF Transcript_2608/g.4587 Transcript_2608/m.4587 type:complete len:142 (-) Transcript_2608:544-969(-)|eukprot:CAMPEP_0182449560 /NCGR_PEP_ID=MMETSP1172-20130603/35252_1 /TAXON_ID=708627 /ORGANISM="Timspurckia oligopyrenoides, Strain CCMP3278" /LENGTH=141 /DNA_ID=CAMNT_0024646881 /DNA_START=39 /DNA_END=464 /DNA_ORIENTATION=-
MVILNSGRVSGTRVGNVGGLNLGPEVNRIVFVRNLPYKMSVDELYDLFGRYGAVFQIRLGSSATTRGTAYVVYEDIFDAKNAVENLSGFNVAGRYIVVLYHQQTKLARARLSAVVDEDGGEELENEKKRRKLDEESRTKGD